MLARATAVGWLLAAAAIASGCQGSRDGGQEAPAVTIRVEAVHPLLALPGQPRVSLGEGQGHAQAGPSPLRFEKMPPGDYAVRVDGPYLVEPVTVHVDAQGRGEATVKVVPLEVTPPASPAPPADSPAPPKKDLFVDLSAPSKALVFWRQGATMIARAEVGGAAGGLAEVVGREWRLQEEGGNVGRAVILVDDKVPVKAVGDAADAVARARREGGAVPPLVVKRKADVEIRPPEPHPWEKSQRPEGASQAAVRFGALTANGLLKPEQIDQVLKAQLPKLEACYWGGLAADAKLTGRVAVRFVIGRDGKTSNAGTSTDLSNDNVVQCFARVLLRAEFPEPEDGIVTVSAPFLLTPGG
ncbi:MAG: AgmX/PglI C-terminal domain-containing protein [Deltaproteobacteria bacterium]|nr:AgmX/PglI C-terminal domain-containing protein [Deltaproteobacteria bacterium]